MIQSYLYGIPTSVQVTIAGEQSIITAPAYFLRFKVLIAISIRPSFASLAGKVLMAAIALLAYSSAKARVCSMPLLWITNCRACLLSVCITQEWEASKLYAPE
jgi:hypothetical protein